MGGVATPTIKARERQADSLGRGRVDGCMVDGLRGCLLYWRARGCLPGWGNGWLWWVGWGGRDRVSATDGNGRELCVWALGPHRPRLPPRPAPTPHHTPVPLAMPCHPPLSPPHPILCLPLHSDKLDVTYLRQALPLRILLRGGGAGGSSSAGLGGSSGSSTSMCCMWPPPSSAWPRSLIVHSCPSQVDWAGVGKCAASCGAGPCRFPLARDLSDTPRALARRRRGLGL